MGFCKNCGNEIKGTKFCTKCGTKVEEASAPAVTDFPTGMGSFGMPEKKKSRGGLIAIIISAVVVVGLVVTYFLFGNQLLGMFGIGKGGPEDVAKAYMEATKECDADKIVDLMHEEYVKALVEDEYDGDKSEMVGEIQDNLDANKDEAAEQGCVWSKLKYKFGEFEDLSGDDLDEIKRDVEEAGLEVKAAKSVEIEITCPPKDKDGEEETETETLYLVQIGNSWYVLMDDAEKESEDVRE